MSRMALEWCFAQDHLTPSERLVLAYLAHRSNSEGTCFPSQTTVSRCTGFTRRRVQQLLRSLIRHGAIEAISRTGERGRQTSNLYLLRYGMNSQRPVQVCGDAVDNDDGGQRQEGPPSTDTGAKPSSPLEILKPRSSSRSTEYIDIGGVVDNSERENERASLRANTQSAPEGRAEGSTGQEVAYPTNFAEFKLWRLQGRKWEDPFGNGGDDENA